MARDILLVNMGGPERGEQVRPYLRAIFSDPRILPLPGPLRVLLREVIAWRRAPKVRRRYEGIGGGSPLPAWTRKQTAALTATLGEGTRRVAHAFRYTAPFINEGLAALQGAGASRVLLVPLFPHHTEAMTGSILAEAGTRAKRLGLDLRHLPAWGLHREVIDLQRDMVREALTAAGPGARLLFVAHGIPQRSVDAGEDYPDRVRENAAAIMEAPDLEAPWSVAFQSRLGPVEWTRPYLEEEIDRLAVRPEPLVIMPLSFVADCLETLHDLDRVASDRARAAGVEQVFRIPAYNDDPRFIRALAGIIEEVDDGR